MIVFAIYKVYLVQLQKLHTKTKFKYRCVLSRDMNNNEDFTNIRVKKATRDRLVKFGIKGETYDDIITKLMDIAEKYVTINP